jgi:hypothetical protein
MLKTTEKVEVFVRIDPPLKWPLWFNGAALDIEEAAPISMPLKLLAKRVNAYFEANTDWCDEHSQYFFITSESALECNSLVKALTNGLLAELDGGYELYPVLAGIDETGHIAIVSDEGQMPEEIVWFPHVCGESEKLGPSS